MAHHIYSLLIYTFALVSCGAKQHESANCSTLYSSFWQLYGEGKYVDAEEVLLATVACDSSNTDYVLSLVKLEIFLENYETALRYNDVLLSHGDQGEALLRRWAILSRLSLDEEARIVSNDMASYALADSQVVDMGGNLPFAVLSAYVTEERDKALIALEEYTADGQEEIIDQYKEYFRKLIMAHDAKTATFEYFGFPK